MAKPYIVQYRPALTSTNPWITLTNYMPPDTGTNVTFFVHSNVAQNPCNCEGGSFASMMASGGGFTAGAATFKKKNSGRSGAVAMLLEQTQEPLAMLKNDLGSLVPASLYPPGFDFSGFSIFDPSSGEWLEGAEFTMRSATSRALSFNGGLENLLESETESSFTPETGFYRVVRNGVHLFGITNRTIFSGIVLIPMEAGNDVGALTAVSIRENGSQVGNSVTKTPFALPLHALMDTTTMSNGEHQISGFASGDSGGGETSGDGVDAESPTITVAVHNEITFPNWLEHFGELYDSVLITAQSAHTNADWFVDVYGSEAGYIGTFAGHTDDGNIYGSWNLVGPGGISYNNQAFFDFVFTTQFHCRPIGIDSAG